MIPANTTLLHLEVINDWSEDVSTFFRILRLSSP